MFKLFIIFIIILILLFPIKIKLTIIFDGNKLNVKMFKINLFSFNIKEFIKLKLSNYNEKDDFNTSTKFDIEKRNKCKFIKKISLNASNLFCDLKNNKLKIKISFFNSISYSTEDSASTAILYGLISTMYYLLFSFLSVLINVDLKENNINPTFEDKTIINLTIKSIIKVNIVQVINMIVIILKNLTFKGGTHKGNEYGK